MTRRDVLVVVLGLALRLVLTATSIGSSDVVYKTLWMQIAERYGIAQAYVHTPYLNDPPLAVAASVALEHVSRGTGVAFSDWFRLTQTLADLASFFCLLLLGRRDAAYFYFLSPPAIAISGFHCNTDPAMVFFVLLAAVLLHRGQPAASGVALALATNVKIVPLLLFPLFFLAARRERETHPLSFAAAWLATMALLLGIPTALAGWPVLRNVVLYRSVGGWWGIVSMLHVAHATRAEAFVRAIDPFVIIAAVGVITWLFLRRERTTERLLAACGLAFTALLVLGTGFGVQYLLWPIAFLPFFAPRTMRVVALTVVSVFLLIVYTQWSHGFPWWFADSDSAGATTDTLVALGWIVWATLAAAMAGGLLRLSLSTAASR